jgi:ADP-heptose:LPS heptosyltransferase
MFWLGVPRTEIPRARLIAGKEPAYLPYAVLHPFASSPPKAWPLQRFVEVAERLQSAGLEPMILAGPADDVSAFAQFQVFRNAPLAEVKNLMAGASLFIGNDSGPTHIAAAFGLPVVVLFGPSNPVTWAPWRTEARVLTSLADIGQITIDEVMAAAETLRGARARA